MVQINFRRPEILVTQKTRHGLKGDFLLIGKVRRRKMAEGVEPEIQGGLDDLALVLSPP